ncbi:MAG: tetratricopeptide repeat protein [bacterium]|nr:tetratricopeptide repeat protein [bacterium]
MRRLPTHSLLLLLLLVVACAPRGSSPRVDPFALPADREQNRVGVTHVVEAGETWRILAEDYYGDPRFAPRLRRANPELKKRPLAVGASILVPLSDAECRAFNHRALARAPYNRGLELARRGDYPGAIVEFSEATDLDSRLAPAYYNLGLVYRRTNRFDLAAEPLRQACKLRPRNSDYLYAQGITARDLGNLKRAERCLHDAIKHDGEHLPSIYTLALLLERQGRLHKARKLWSLYIRLDPFSARGEEAKRHLEGGP